MKNLIFTNRFSAIIALNSSMPVRSELEKFSGVPLIAADGACLRLKAIGIDPDFIVGDLDSLRESGRSGEFANNELIEISDQETNDFEKALAFALGKGWRSVLIVGFHGGELEHTLNNISVLKKFSSRMQMCLYEHGRYAVCAESSFALRTDPGEIISLVPLPAATVTTHGLKWPLTNDLLQIGLREGHSNRAIEEEISVEIHSGALLVFFKSREPLMPSFE